ncbi:cytochrome-c peroxidase [Neotabrizicola shimadae]|uniref:Cytochrome c domain-containing protein n=1 Tax=Neotabrizicola shimadae TaxID=2807096 RepID=A0A8G0ZQE6_9RHOB|nr:c-type cytochrome [Neotabrizicola shimadae]QYZ69556.1 hypothetical protein JO391_17825 [Neotabrizicola shimadae]
MIRAAACLPAGADFALDASYIWPLPDWMPRPPVPADNPMSAEKVERGRHRFECCHCHSGVQFTDTIQTALMPEGEVGYHNTGLHADYSASAPGLIGITGRPQDAGHFRTPDLRNVAVTAPCMHDGSIPDLSGAIGHYASAGRADHPMKDGMIQGFRVSDAEIADLIAFLEGPTDEGFLTDPSLSDPWPEGHPARAPRQMP